MHERLYNTFGHGPPYTHIQSMFFILNKDGFDFLDNQGFFDSHENDFTSTVINKEFKLSQLILKNNWNINCILSHYRDLDYRKIDKNINPTGPDPYFPGSYFGETINAYEVIFYKITRLPPP